MRSTRLFCHWSIAATFLLGSAVCAPSTSASAQDQTASAAGDKSMHKSYPAALVEDGGSLFKQNCSFCHGQDARGGETGPDLTQSKLVTEDVDGNKIGAVVRNGRTDKGMPHFDLTNPQMLSLAAFIHTQQTTPLKRIGGRKSVEVADLQTGNVEAGKQYFNGAGGCGTCHSPIGDLAGIASRYQGLKLEQQMLYPKDATSKVTVTLASGQTIAGTLKYLDEFTVGLNDASGAYRSWRTSDVKYAVDSPVDAHRDLFDKYTDTNIHDLMAYLQTLR